MKCRPMFFKKLGVLRNLLDKSVNFEEARKAYSKFYSLDFRKYGVDIPPRLEEISKNKKLLEAAREPLQLIKNEGIE